MTRALSFVIYKRRGLPFCISLSAPPTQRWHVIPTTERAFYANKHHAPTCRVLFFAGGMLEPKPAHTQPFVQSPTIVCMAFPTHYSPLFCSSSQHTLLSHTPLLACRPSPSPTSPCAHYSRFSTIPHRRKQATAQIQLPLVLANTFTFFTLAWSQIVFQTAQPPEKRTHIHALPFIPTVLPYLTLSSRNDLTLERSSTRADVSFSKLRPLFAV